ncbi:DeoR/GlpR family DNA-binding transcription regulator [Cellulomonas sp. KRMCY2]|uniref:DeoR/GlpR family DNA-binding transcription regulator n=1 Tax=Cellulomonas sp. KRMCY2 TaxID=1304865 RepID=UPI00045E8A8C|nr:DeoR/GlpR family DNA-binding transcription regulator [Cellulomonas sp. KRMCY2]
MAATKRPPRLPARRKDELVTYVDKVGEVTVSELSEHFDVSVDTARRDLDELAAAGLLKRTHGGAVRITTLTRSETPFPDRMRVHGAAKRRIGRLAASLIEDGQTILLNGGTTTLAVLPHLAVRRNLTVVTNNLVAPSEMPRECARDVYLLGGNVRVGSQVTVGPVEFPGTDGSHSHRIQADIALISVGGVAEEMGYSTSNLHEARMMLEMMQSARVVVVLADSSKFDRSIFAQVAELSAADILVTDAPVSEPMAEALAAAQVKVMVAWENSGDAL